MEGPRHGYDLQRLINSRAMDRYINLVQSSMYKRLNSLEAEGLIKSHFEKAGTRPERQVYQLTAQGEKRLKELIQQALHTTATYYDPLYAALTFAHYIPRDAVITALQARKETCEHALCNMQEILKQLQVLTKEEYGVSPIYGQVILKSGITMMNAAVEWLTETIKELREE